MADGPYPGTTQLQYGSNSTEVWQRQIRPA